MMQLSYKAKQAVKKLIGPKATLWLKSLIRPNLISKDGDLIIGIDATWSTDYVIGIAGWAICKKGPLDELTIEAEGNAAQVTNWIPRPDVANEYSAQLKTSDRCGFLVQIPRKAEYELEFKGKNTSGQFEKIVAFKGKKPPPVIGINDGSNIFNEFVKHVNNNKLRVLEIGSRVVSPGSKSKRELFPGASTYVGFDYYPDSNTDVVGDAHELSKYFNGQKFDAIFSLQVLEHIAMPWKVVLEISKLLDIGGVTCHVTHQTWPIHEAPWDFWRFSDESLKALFSPPLGFKTIKAGLIDPMYMHMTNPQPGHELLPISPGFGGCVVFARKVSDIDSDKFKWDVKVEDILGQGHFYPEPGDLKK